MNKRKVIRFKRFSLTFEWWMVLVFLLSIFFSYDAIATTCYNVEAYAPWWHTAFTAVESLAFVTVACCCVLKALQPNRPGRARFYYTVALVTCALITVRQFFFEYERLFMEDPNWLQWILSPLSLLGWCFVCYLLGRVWWKYRGQKVKKNNDG